MYLRIVPLLIACLMLAGCGTAYQVRDQFVTDSQTFNKLLRWHELPTLCSLYVVDELQAQCLRATEAAGGVELADLRVVSSQCQPELGRGTVVVELDYFRPPSYTLKSVIFRQQWIYREVSGTRRWLVSGDLPNFP